MAIFQKVTTQGLFTEHLLRLRKFDKDLLILLDQVFSNLENLLNRGLSFEDNVESVTVTYTSNAVANTEDTVAHTLGKVPTGFIVTDTDKGGVVYRGGTAFTTSNIYLKCTTASTALKVLVF